MRLPIEPGLRNALSGDRTPKFLATLDAEGRPNCVPVISINPYGEGGLIFGEFFMNKTRRNLLGNPRVGIAVLNEAFEGWSLKGNFQGFETTGPAVDAINRLPMFRYNAYTGVRAAGRLTLEQISEKRRLSRPRLLTGFLHASMRAALSSPKRDGAGCMPARVEEKFRRISAVRALAYRDDDGWPCAFPLVSCVAAGPNRLIVSDALASPFLRRIPPDAPVAVAIITMEPIAYQVKGQIRHGAAGTATIDLSECYSASPPLLGQALHPEQA